LASIIDTAAEYLAAAQQAELDGKGGLSKDQVATLETWITEARSRLNDYIVRHSRGLDAIFGESAAPTPLPLPPAQPP